MRVFQREQKNMHTSTGGLCAKGKEMPSDFIWTKNADVVVNEYGRKNLEERVK